MLLLILVHPRSTYFHMKWNMWGHTWSDIANDASISTAWPFNILRSLAIWKPRNRFWGYDLLLSAALRAANEQSGMEVYDLETFVKLKMNGLFRYPKWLQGTVSRESDTPWQTYIQETLDKTFRFLQLVNGVVLGFYMTVALAFALISSRRRHAPAPSGSGLKSATRRLLQICGWVALFTWAFLRRVETSEWGSNLLVGKTFRRPFPTYAEFSSQRWEQDPMVPRGITTLPERTDVLFGTRLDAEYLGSYNQWFDYHPGNRLFSDAIASKTLYYSAVYDQDLMLNALINNLVDEVKETTNNGRFLEQDHLSGDWVVLADADVFERVRLTLATESNLVSKQVHQAFKFLLADARFGDHRGTSLAFESCLFLLSLRDHLFGQPKSETAKSFVNSKPANRSHFSVDSRALELAGISTVRDGSFTKSGSRLPKTQSSSSNKEQLTAGTAVMVYWSVSDEWVKGIIDSVVEAGHSYDVEYDDGVFEEGVSIRSIRKPVHLQEGTRVTGYLEDNAAYDGKVAMVYPGGNIDIAFDDGDFATDFLPGEYDLIYPPFEM